MSEQSVTEITKHLPEIIKAAATSNLGIIALMVILFSGLAYGFFRKSKEGWRLAALLLFFVGCISFGYAVLISAQQTPIIPNPQLDAGLQSLADRWIQEAEKARSAKTISPGRPLPSALVDARNAFESAWKNAAPKDRKTLQPEQASKVLSYLNRLYRVVEIDSSTQPNANYWADEAIHFFEETQDRKYLTEALVDKAAIYLDIAQLGHNDKQQFERIAREGDAVMVRAYQTADVEQRPSVLRISSRFYYNLALPKSFRLSEDWDNNYLLLAYQKAQEAYELAPDDSKNANQLARTVIKASKNPPQDSDRVWTLRLRESKDGLKKAWLDNQSKLSGLDQRLSPLNVLGVSTLETIAREWSDLDFDAQRASASRYIEEIESDALGPLREVVALLQNSELRKSYGFDLYYDIARAYALKTAILRTISPQLSAKEFIELKTNLSSAKENAKTSQLEAAVKDLNREITFTLLTSDERASLLATLSVGAQ